MILGYTKRERYMRRAPIMLIIVMMVFICSALLNAQAASTYHVSVKGNDTSEGTESAPFKTISKAAHTARSGDHIIVHSGTYREVIYVTNSGVTFKAADTAARPLIDGHGEHDYGFRVPKNVNVDNITIEGFEISGQKKIGIFIESRKSNKFLIKNNVIHHIEARGISLEGGREHRVADNFIYMIANSGESFGVKLGDKVSNSLVDGNQIFLIRKGGIRDKGKRNLIKNNIVYLSNGGVNMNAADASSILNNLVYNTRIGTALKHTTGEKGWNIYAHNTIYNTLEHGIGLGINGKKADFLDVRNNIVSEGGAFLVKHRLKATGPNVRLDGNAYSDRSGSTILYTGKGGKSKSLAEMRQKSGFEKNGIDFEPLFTNVANSNFNVENARTSLPLSTPFGNQLGAQGLHQTSPHWIAYNLTVAGASSNRKTAEKAIDGNGRTFWETKGKVGEWIAFDLGKPQRIAYIIPYPLRHHGKFNMLGFDLLVSDDNKNYVHILSGSHNSSGSGPIYELPPETTARYFKIAITKNHGADTTRIAHVRAGRLEGEIGSIGGTIRNPAHTVNATSRP